VITKPSVVVPSAIEATAVPPPPVADESLVTPKRVRPTLTRRGTITVTESISFDFEAARAKDAEGRAQHQFFAWLNWAPPLDSPCYNTLHRYFPGAIPGQALHARTAKILTEDKIGCTPENTLFGCSICPDEINNEKGDLAYIMREYWGEVFPLGGISGAPFAGKTGFKAFSHHVPENGNVLVLFGPHVAISEAGEVGKYLRDGQSEHSTACGAIIGAYNACLCGDVTTNEEEYDETDLQMSWIKKQLAPHVKHVQGQENPMASLAHQAYEMVRAKTLGVVNNDFGSGHLILVGGIQINMPKPCDDHFLPLMFELRKPGCPAEDLMPGFDCQKDLFA